MVLAISQSGETADTLAALREAKRKGALVLGLVNVVGSTIARETHAGVYSHAGIEVGVASTKSFTSQLTILTLMALLIGRSRDLSYEEGHEIIRALENGAGPDSRDSEAGRERFASWRKNIATRTISFSWDANFNTPSPWKAR